MAPRSPGAVASVPAVDPIKILKKYIWLLVGALGFGLFAGFASYVVLGRYAPVWHADVQFRALGPGQDVARPEGEVRVDERELTRFMETQVVTLRSPVVLEPVISDPRLGDLVPGWASRFLTDSGRVDPIDAIADLQTRVSARVNEGTELFTMSVGWRSADEARVLASLITEKYTTLRGRTETTRETQQAEAVRTQIADLESRVTQFEADKARLIRDGDVDAIDAAASEAGTELRKITLDLSDARNDRALLAEQIDIRRQQIADQEQGGALQFTALQIAQVQTLPSVARMKDLLQSYETRERSLELRGYSENHRARKDVRREIEATESELAALQERELENLFFAELEQFEEERKQLDAQIADLSERLQERRLEQVDLTRTLEEIRTVDQRRTATEAQILNRRQQLSTLEASGGRSRVQIQQAARARDRRTSPRFEVMLAGGVFLCVGLTAGLVIIREVLDQRIKGPSDVALIPRTRVLGLIPLATEDPQNPKHFETIVRDQPKGMLAESFRQLCTVTLKRMRHAGAKTLLVAPASPGSGSTSIITNLAYAASAVEQRVLIIDANFRRPGVHKALGLEESPGLSDLLARVSTVDEAIVNVAPGIDVLPAGTPQHRIFDRLAGSQMGEILGQAAGLYDLVLIDVAPAVVSGDAIALANRCDASIMVVRALAEKRGMVARLRNELGEVRAEMLGVLVNAVRASAGGYMRRNIRTAHEYQGNGKAAASGSDSEKERSAA